jgi:hypothetical protein
LNAIGNQKQRVGVDRREQIAADLTSGETRNNATDVRARNGSPADPRHGLRLRRRISWTERGPDRPRAIADHLDRITPGSKVV